MEMEIHYYRFLTMDLALVERKIVKLIYYFFIESFDMENSNKLIPIIETEENRARSIVTAMQETLKIEEDDIRRQNKELADLKRQKLEAVGWREKREIDELIVSRQQQMGMRRFQDSKVLVQPYFGTLELADDDLGTLNYCLGRQSFIDNKARVLVIDWRDAPISRLYYEYGDGELYDETIRGRDRSGVVSAKRQVEITNQELEKIAGKDAGKNFAVVRTSEGWVLDGQRTGVIFKKEKSQDHRLPEITALIDPAQFRAIASEDSSVVVLSGSAGSGKTTVGLHRIAFLNYQDPKRFKPESMLVIVFNRSLRKYISRVLPDLGISGVRVETYHSWANQIFKAARLHLFYDSSAPAPVTRLKKSAFIFPLVEQYLESLLSKAKDWLIEQLGQYDIPGCKEVASQLPNLDKFDFFYEKVSNRSGIFAVFPETVRDALLPRLMARLNDHARDLREMLTDRELLESVSARLAFDVEPKVFDQLISWQQQLESSQKIDFSDTGILLYLLQRKGVPVARPGYAHGMVDEAQDLSEVELTTLIHAVDERQSITICGDLDQKIKGEFDFSDADGFAGVVKRVHGRQKGQGKTGAAEATEVRLDTLTIGYRATRSIMELSWHVLGKTPATKIAREGGTVQVLRTADPKETLEKTKTILEEYLQKNPNALVAVICKYKSDADRAFEGLKTIGCEKVRRHSRDDFAFTPGVIVTNADQVKGLEFSGCVVLNPSSRQYQDTSKDRMLLHVAFTRAADHLWVIGHEPMAYGIEDWKMPEAA